MNDKQWISEAKKLLKAIKFNKEHPSPGRVTLGSDELLKIDELLGENNE